MLTQLVPHRFDVTGKREMLLRMETLKKIQSGHVTTAFRKWRRPTVKPGSSLKTAVGVLSISGVDKINERQITKRDVVAAGYEDRKTVIAELRKRDGDIYRIRFEYAGADPRIALRQNTAPTRQEVTQILERLQRLDLASRHGAWTNRTLMLIREKPCQRAADLAEYFPCEKDWLKLNVRKLKNLGLTISEAVGYRISPLGLEILKHYESQSQE